MLRSNNKKNPGEIEGSSSEELLAEDAAMMMSDDGGDEGLSHRPGKARSPMIDESMILSDNEEDYDPYHHHGHGQQPSSATSGNNSSNAANQNNTSTASSNTANSQHTGSSARPPKNKYWTGGRKKHTSSANAQAALLVEDKPWRSRGSNHHPTTNTGSSTPKSPSRFSQLVMPNRGLQAAAELPPTPNFASASTTSNASTAITGVSPNDANTPNNNNAKRPLLKYIRGFTNNVSSPSSPRKNRSMDNNNNPPPNWSDGDDDDQSSMSSSDSDMISYSSLDSMDSDDDLVLARDDYTHHPEETQIGFWNQLPFVPAHFLYDATEATPNQLPYLDPQLKTLLLQDASQIANFQFVLDHRLYVRALFQLLAEREEMGVEDSIHDDQNIIKKGPLRKKYLGKANYKYVELRKGNLVYFGNDTGGGRKTIHLRSATASCVAVDDDDNPGNHHNAAVHHHHHHHATTPTPGSSANSGGGGGGGGGGINTIIPIGAGITMSGSGPAMHQAADSLKAGLTSAVSATASAASTIAGGAPQATAVGFEFHLWVEGKRYAWLANSKHERSSWVNAIRQAMIGVKNNNNSSNNKANNHDDDWGMTLNAANTITAMAAAPTSNLQQNNDDYLVGGTSHEEAFYSYQKLQSQLYHAVTLSDYLESLLSLAPHPDTPSSTSPALQIPLKCLGEDLIQKTRNKEDDDHDNRQQHNKAGMSQRRRLQEGIAEFWESMTCYDFAINGHVIDKDSPCAAERIVGSLVRCILDYDRSFAESNEVPPANRISELDAVSYARSILLLMIKSRTSGDVEFAVENLLQNDHLIMLESIDACSALSSTSDALHIDVSFAGDDLIDHNDETEQISNEASGWVMVRRSKYNSWKSRFCVFSEGVFSYYENAKPRPHGLRGQLLLSGATLSEVDDEKDRAREDSGLYILRLTTKGPEKRERQFGFKSKEEFLEWREVIENVLDSCDSNSMRQPNDDDDEFDPRGAQGHKKSRSLIGGGTKLISYATDESIRAAKAATSSSIKAVKGGTKMAKDAAGAFTKGATNLMFRSIRSGRARAKRGETASTRSIRKVPSMQMLMEKTRSDKTGRREPTVQVVIQATSEFSIIPRTGSGPGDEAVVTVRVKFLQAYLLSGGSSGRLARGDAMLEYTFIDENPGLADDDENDN
ncbi:expressed unknown protein [Seminavis robusta]|uniref:PH domain-containing protein n=1 Tax=Seminavis robusta TaxID=568900 RepID=A0A9N8HLN1_9STRA|nr:expressed unknown protein [Seminavis robusta]|eukprot:Sro694_g188420.1 n/a (1158) ;mRNA; r:1772-5358